MRMGLRVFFSTIIVQIITWFEGWGHYQTKQFRQTNIYPLHSGMSEDGKKWNPQRWMHVLISHMCLVKYCLIFFMQTSTNAMDLVFCRFFDEHVK